MKNEHECIMEEKIDILNKKVDQILIAMKGNDMGTTGVVPRLDKCERKIYVLEAFKARAITITGIITSLIATGITLLVSFLIK